MIPESRKDAPKTIDSDFDFLPFCESCVNPCCNGYLVCTETEYQRIVEYSGQDHAKKKKGYYEISGDPCPYLTKTGRCSIHPVRPRICQMYPYYPDVDDKTHAIQIKLDPKCPACVALDRPFKEKAYKIAHSLLDELGRKKYVEFWYD